MNERLLWSYIVQLGGAIKVVHNAGLAVRNLEPNRILITGVNRVRIGGCGALDVLVWDGSISSSNYQVGSLFKRFEIAQLTLVAAVLARGFVEFR